MSCYNWERGTITIPAKAYSGLRLLLLTKWNEQQEALLKDAQAAYNAIKTAIKGKRGKARKDAIEAALDAHCTGRTRDWRGYLTTPEVNWDRKHNIERLITTRPGGWNGPVTLQTPKRKDVGIVPVSKSCTLRLGEASITFNNANRTVTWDVPENNRAVERAREHSIAQALFKALGRIEWTRGSGGQIVGNDEYNRDCDYEGGGSNYVVATYSKAQQEADRKARATRRRYDYGSYGMSYGRRW